MKIETCEFPEELLYDNDFNVWIKKEKDYKLGITSLFSWFLGKIIKVKLKPLNEIILKNKTLCILESLTKTEPIKAPFDCKIIEINKKILEKPKIINNSPYSEGWIMKIKILDENEINKLANIEKNIKKIKEIINKLHVKCFKAIPDYHMYEIGVECAAVIPKLNEFFKNQINKNEILLLISDDPSAYVEMIRWTDQTKNELVEARKENNLWYFLIKKI